MRAVISDIKRFAVHDGPGIRTTVFFKGCSLKCLWCHNPEGISRLPQLAYYPDKCLHCMSCGICPHGAHVLENSHIFLRENCQNCGDCQSVCLGDALHFYGRRYTVEKLLPQLLEDKAFYENSGGGVTLSGGECLLQADFCAELLKALKAQGIHTAVDTCGFVNRESLDKVIPHTDLFLYDLKAMDEALHTRLTGQSNGLILENLRYLDSLGKNIHIRIPFVPGCNDDQMPAMAQFVKTLSHVSQVDVLAYHNYAGSKYEALGMENTLPPTLPTPEQIAEAQSLFH